MKPYKIFKCSLNDDGRRVDRLLKKLLPDVPAGLIYSAIRKGLIKVNGKKVKQDYRTRQDDQIEVSDLIDSTFSTQTKTNNLSCKFIDNITIFRNENLILLNKPAGLLTHGKNSLASYLKQGIANIDESLSFCPAPLHRLDRNTSGLIAASLSLKGAQHFSELVRSKKIKKYYLGLCKGEIKNDLHLVTNLTRSNNKTKRTYTKGSRAVTYVKPILSQKNFTIALFQIETGITHQIRSQISEAGYPLCGDNKYNGFVPNFNSYCLHSFSLVLPDNDVICGFKNIKAPLPSVFKKRINKLFNISTATLLDKIICIGSAENTVKWQSL